MEGCFGVFSLVHWKPVWLEQREQEEREGAGHENQPHRDSQAMVNSAFILQANGLIGPTWSYSLH